MIYLFSSSEYDDVINMPLIEFKILQSNIDFSGYDYLLFTSKNGVKLLEQVTKEWSKYPSIAIGEETSKIIKKLGGSVVFEANGYSENLAEQIKIDFNNKKILYIRPKVVATDYIDNLKNKNVNIDQFLLYETLCKKYDISKKPSLDSVLIFTSPSTIECFMDNFKSLQGYNIVCIGTTTSKALPGDIKYHMPKVPNINECIKLAFELQK